MAEIRCQRWGFGASDHPAKIAKTVDSDVARAPGDLAETEGSLAARSDATGRGDLW
jgi:hypothetical protein